MGIILFSGCSVTKHLPEGEVLYTGGKTVIQNKSTTPVGGTALTEIEAALDKTPSTKMLGGLLPIPFKMWMYNDFVKYKKGFGKWMFNRLAANPPVFISTVNPEVRIKVALTIAPLTALASAFSAFFCASLSPFSAASLFCSAIL